MTRKIFPLFAAAFAAIAMLSACGSDDPEPAPLADTLGLERADAVPQSYGLYALQDGRIGRLNGDCDFETSTWSARSSLDPEVQFIIFDRTLATSSALMQEMVTLYRVAQVRNEVGAAGPVVPAKANSWAVAALPPFQVPLQFRPVPGHGEMVQATPVRPLPPGLYSLRLRGSASVIDTRFGVGWDQVDQARYARDNCVDRIAGTPLAYRLCSDEAAGGSLPVREVSSEGLMVRSVRPSRLEVLGEPMLIIEGVIANTSNQMRRVPPLRASLRDSQGREIGQWTFQAEVASLPPGRSTGFRTEVASPPAGTQDVALFFQPEANAGQ